MILQAWGYNFYGQLGNGNTINQSAPVVINLSNVVAISAGGNHSLALKSDGYVWACGLNNVGALGIGNTTNQPVYMQVINLNSVHKISGGVNHSMALKSDGTVLAWGMGSNSPVQVTPLSGCIEISPGVGHRLALTV
jgi:hypothetical protein